MRKTLSYIIKSILKNPNLIGWGVLFILFWGVIGAYVSTPGEMNTLPESLSIVKSSVYTDIVSAWYAVLMILFLSAIGVSLTFLVYFQSGALPYLFKYSKLTPSKYLMSMFSGGTIAGIVLSLILTYAISGMFSTNGVGYTVMPTKPYVVFPVVILSFLFLISLSFFLVLISMKFGGVKYQQLVNYIPLILGFIFYSLYNFASSYPEWVTYASPYLNIISLLFYGYSGNKPPVTGASGINAPTVSVEWSALFLTLWTIGLFLIDTVLLRKINYEPIEEAKIM
ncbi:hypothetical protein [Acidianus manzaensis]|uniref:Uncharacterized protein n=1 Tax=Acidianus manzaensis TaxID=282676 RepID=A0A1W6JYS1_9CREN|nr:hypothetical protein [Acidianus manzaensis]ARM75360.1 hypothetical protein B6F84_04495 [Acidianus manzaensis]